MLRVIELHTADAMYLIRSTPKAVRRSDEYLDNEDGDVPDDDIGDDVTDDRRTTTTMTIMTTTHRTRMTMTTTRIDQISYFW
ncbi:MAG: hypothetical protein IPI91_09220 [Flavobacteriales bacterium]|nr:hypothetical protein [Flavobacteriales bacterium]